MSDLAFMVLMLGGVTISVGFFGTLLMACLKQYRIARALCFLTIFSILIEAAIIVLLRRSGLM